MGDVEGDNYEVFTVVNSMQTALCWKYARYSIMQLNGAITAW